MRSRIYVFKATLVAVLGVATSSFAGEKIQFSAPSEKTESSPRTREIPTTKNSILDSFNRGSTPEFLTAPVPQAVPDARRNDAKGKEKDWVFGKPDEAPAMDELFKSAESDEKAESARSDSKKNFLPDLNSQNDSRDSNYGRNDHSFSESLNANTRANSDSDFRPKWDQGSSFSERRALTGQSGIVTDFLKDRDAERDRFSTHALERRGQFEQLFQPRVAEPIANFADKTRLPANPTMAMPEDLLARPNSNFQQSWRDTGAVESRRLSASDNLSPSAVGRGASAFDNTQDVRIKPQPTVLPFPERPGQLFKRPGS